ncbi:MAG: hypothetical protein ACYTGO_15070 [Planctomycetota bacterium]|jgi:hypothetical protein
MQTQTILTAALALVVAASTQTQASAQSKIFESLTGWKHLGTSPEWTDDVTNNSSPFGKVDQLNSTKNLSYTKNVILEAGTYVATARLMKFKDQTGVAPIEVGVAGSAGNRTTNLPVFEQKTDKWVFTPAVTFTLKTKGVVIFVIKNTDTNITKQNYYFDSFRIGLVPEGEVFVYQSLTHNTWQSVHGGTWHTKNFPDKDSAFGEVNKLNNVWWLEFQSWKTDSNKNRVSNRLKLQPGTYTWNIRLKRTGTTNNAIFETSTAVGGGKFTKKTWSNFQPPRNQWVLTPNDTFVVTQKDTIVDFRLWDIRNTLKSGYLFDAFVLWKGAFNSLGTACKSSLGVTSLTANPPSLGGNFKLKVDNAPGRVLFALGLKQLKLDLSPAGMPNCFLYVEPLFVAGANASNGIATMQMPVPNTPALKGVTFLTQALTADAKINGFGGVMTNAATVIVGG